LYDPVIMQNALNFIQLRRSGQSVEEIAKNAGLSPSYVQNITKEVSTNSPQETQSDPLCIVF